jgi:MFS family permease
VFYNKIRNLSAKFGLLNKFVYLCTVKSNKMDANFHLEQSLSLINEMINRARSYVKTTGAYSLIFWGYVITALAITNSVLMNTLNEPIRSFWIWGLMLPAGLVAYFIDRRANRKVLVKTHLDKINAMVWIGFFISVIVFTTVIHIVNIKLDTYQIFMLNTPVILLLLGMGQFISACIYRTKMWYVIAIQTWVGATICAFVGLDIQFIIFAVCVIIGFIIPGHIMNHQAKKNRV